EAGVGLAHDLFVARVGLDRAAELEPGLSPAAFLALVEVELAVGVELDPEPAEARRDDEADRRDRLVALGQDALERDEIARRLLALGVEGERGVEEGVLLLDLRHGRARVGI